MTRSQLLGPNRTPIELNKLRGRVSLFANSVVSIKSNGSNRSRNVIVIAESASQLFFFLGNVPMRLVVYYTV